MSAEYATWSIEQLDREIAGVAANRDACLRGDWGPERRGMAEGYQDRIDSMVLARNLKIDAALRYPQGRANT